MPATYAFQAYDAALLIDSALKATKGDTANKDALRAALRRRTSSRCAARSSSTPTTIRSRTSTWSRSPSAPTASSRPRSPQKVFDELQRSARQGLPDEVSAGLPSAPLPRVRGEGRSDGQPAGTSHAVRSLRGRSPQRARATCRSSQSRTMSTALLLVQTLNGLQLGVLLFLIAAGLTLVFGVMDFINLAHGVQYMLGAYLAVMFYGLTGSFLAALVLALLAALAVRAAARVRGVPPSLRPRPPRPGDRDLRHHPVPQPGREVRLGRGAAQPADAGALLRLRRADARPALSGLAPRHHRVRAGGRGRALHPGQPHPRRHAGARRRHQCRRWCRRSASTSAGCS